MAKANQKFKGVNFVLNSNDRYHTLNFPVLLGGQWFDQKNNKFVEVKQEDYKKERRINDKVEHCTEIVISKKSPQVKEIKKILTDMAKEYKLPKNCIFPVTDGNELAAELEEKGKNGDNYIDTTVLKAKTKMEVKFFDKAVQSYTPENDDELKGMYCNAVVMFKPYKVGVTVGIKCYLSKLQLLEKNPNFEYGISAEDAFSPVQFGEDEKEEVLNKAVDDIDDELPLEAGITNNTVLDDQINSDIEDSDPFAS